MAERPTTGELFKAKSVTEADLDAAADAYMADPTTFAFIMGEGHVLDLAAAVAASKFAVDMLADPGIKDTSKRSAVRTDILLARPV